MTFASYMTVEWAPASTPLAASPTWVDVTSKVRSMRIVTGSRSAEDVFAAGSATLDVNNKLPGSAAWLDTATWYRYRQVRISLSGGSVLFRGWIKSVTHDLNFPTRLSQARIECIDAIGLLSEASADADAAAAISAGTNAHPKTIDNTDGYVTDGGVYAITSWLAGVIGLSAPIADAASIMPVFVASKQSGSALQLLQDYLEAERGRLTPYTSGIEVDVMGRYKDFALYNGTSASFTDVPGQDYRYLLGSLVLAAPDDTYHDTAVIGGKGIDPQTTADVPTGYPPSAYTRVSQSPIADANWAKANADLIVAAGKQTTSYPRQVTCHVAAPTATTYDSGHPASFMQAGNASCQFSLGSNFWILGVIAMEQNISTQDGWRCTFGFSSLDRLAAAYTSTSIFVLGTSALGGSAILGP